MTKLSITYSERTWEVEPRYDRRHLDPWSRPDQHIEVDFASMSIPPKEGRDVRHVESNKDLPDDLRVGYAVVVVYSTGQTYGEWEVADVFADQHEAQALAAHLEKAHRDPRTIYKTKHNGFTYGLPGVGYFEALQEVTVKALPVT